VSYPCRVSAIEQCRMHVVCSLLNNDARMSYVCCNSIANNVA